MNAQNASIFLALAGLLKLNLDSANKGIAMNKFKRQKVSAYIKQNFVAPYPGTESIIRGIKNKEIPGASFCGRWYVHVDDNGDLVRELNEFEIEALKMHLEHHQNVTA